MFMAFIVLTKTFDTVDCQTLWSILARSGCHDKYIKILRLLHDGMSVTVLSSSGSESDLFTVKILHLIGEEMQQQILIMYRTDGRLFKI